jgi:hypothetical protein
MGALLGAAAASTAVAGLYAALAAAAFEWRLAPFLRFAAAGAVPVAAVVAVCGWRLGRNSVSGGRGALLMPVAPLLLGAVGMLTLIGFRHFPYTGAERVAAFLMMGGGAALIGVAAGWMCADRIVIRIFAAVPLAGVTAVICTFSVRMTAGVFVVAMMSWWIRRAWQIAPPVIGGRASGDPATARQR